MKYEEFRKTVANMPLINNAYLRLTAENSQAFKNQLRRWVLSGKVLRLRRGLYILAEEDRKIKPSRAYISRELYSPSYVSMEYALAFYGLIPERVADMTCISTKKTVEFQNVFGRFVYQHVQEKCFTGFTEMKDESGLSYYMALPEKAIIDFIYLNMGLFKTNINLTVKGSFRLQNMETLDRRKLRQYAALFESKKLSDIVRSIQDEK